MAEDCNPYASPQDGADHADGGDYLIVGGNVYVGKEKGTELLLTRKSAFAFRANMQAAMMGGITGGLIGALIGYFIDKHRAKKRAPPPHINDPEMGALPDSVQQKFAAASLLCKLPLNSDLDIERTRLGFKFTDGATTIVYQGLFHKSKITNFLAGLGIDAG